MKNLRYSVLSMLVLFIINGLFAQEKSQTIRLIPVEYFPDYGFTITEVIDQRIVKSNIGFVLSGLKNERLAVKFPDKIEDYLLKNLKRAFRPCTDCEGIAVILHEFEISEEQSLLSKYSIFKIRIEFAREIEGQYYSLGIAEKMIEKSNLDISDSHNSRILRGLKECFDLLYSTDWKNNKVRVITDLFLDKSLITAVPPEGFFENFTKLANRESQIPRAYKFTKLKSFDDNYRYYLAQQKHFFAQNTDFISDGTSLFMHASLYSTEGYYVKCQLFGRFLYFEDNVSYSDAKLLLGNLGNSLSKSRGIVLDSKTGIVTILHDKNMKYILKEFPDMLHKYEQHPEFDKDFCKLIIRELNKNGG